MPGTIHRLSANKPQRAARASSSRVRPGAWVDEPMRIQRYNIPVRADPGVRALSPSSEPLADPCYGYEIDTERPANLRSRDSAVMFLAVRK
ncbi:hypothetical protein VTH06DRAFT_7533 [Thermothelomyces fergusii]